MALSEVSRSVDGIERALTDMDLVVMAPIAFMTAGGMVLAQEAVDLVFPRLNLSPNPSNNAGLGAAAIFKMALAIALAYGGSMAGGRAVMAVAVVLAIGVLGSSGADLIDLFQSVWSGFGGSSSSQTRRSRNASRSRQNRRTTQASGQRRQASPSRSGRGSTRASSPDAKKLERQTWG